jgi:multiple sugar transport system substrate-binding protein
MPPEAWRTPVIGKGPGGGEGMADVGRRVARRMVKYVVLVGAVVLSAVALAACGGDDDGGDSAGAGAKPKELSILYATVEAASDALLAQVPAYEEKTGIKLNVDTIAYDALQQKVFSELAAGSSEYDLLAVDTPWMPTVIGKVEPIGKYVQDAKLNDQAEIDLGDFIPKVFYDTAVYQASDVQAQYEDSEAEPDAKGIQDAGFDVYGLPIQSNALTVSYRADLFEDPKEKAAFKEEYGRDLAPPATWDEFTEVAKFFTRPEEKLWGTTMMAGVGDWSTDDFKTLLHSFGGDGHLVSPENEPTFNTPEGVEALTYYADLINKEKVTPRGTTSATWDTVATTFGQGLTAMGLNYHNMALKEGVKGEVKYALVPEGERRGPHFGSWMLSVNKASKNKEWAYRTAAWLTSAETQKKMVAQNLHPTRTSVYESVAEDPEVKKASGNFYEVLGESLAVGVGRARLKNYFDISNHVAVAVNRAASGKATPQEALEKAAADVESALAK